MKLERLALAFLGVMLLTGCGDDRATGAQDGSLRLGAVLGSDGADDPGYRRADAPRAFRFPADHGPHPAFRSEWWYLTFTLTDAAGRPVGVQFTLFRQALAPSAPNSGNRWQTNQVYLAHFAVTDAAAGEHRVAERFARGHPRLAGVVADPFRLWIEDWRIEGNRDRWHLTAAAGGQSVDLVLHMDRRPVLQGDGGLSRKGEHQASYYYSVPGFPVEGVVAVDGRERTVHGTGWLDREWSTSVLAGDQIGWDWFALQLDDGRCLMLFQLRRNDGSRDPFDQGMLVAPGAPDRHLGADDFELTPERYWRDEDGIDWPVGWSVRIGAREWRVEAVVDDQKMDTTVRYWEGLVDVLAPDGERVGRGYLELTGYGPRTGMPGEIRR
jgi:predicted secreted hydrolase